MSDRLERIYKLLNSQKSRASYIKAKLVVLVPAQIRALRLSSTNPRMPYQRDLAREADVHQSRISMFETPGAANITLETLSKIAAGLRVGVIVKFVPFHEMLGWENSFSPESFNVLPRLEQDQLFINPSVEKEREADSSSSGDGSNVAASGDIAEVNSAGAERKPMGTVDDQAQMAAAGNGG
jgi:transcriptional regulator with XRE-family HTH domain